MQNHNLQHYSDIFEMKKFKEIFKVQRNLLNTIIHSTWELNLIKT